MPDTFRPDAARGEAGTPGAGARHLAIVGPTAAGKTALALALARRHPGLEVVSADSMSVYRGMDIGTAKPTPAERAEVPHHCLDLADPSEEFTVRHYQDAARDAIAAVEGRGGRVLLVGGTGLYVRAVLDPLSIPGRYPGLAAELETEADTATGLSGLYQRLATLDPVAAARIEPGNRRRIVRALEVTLGGGRPFSSYGSGLGSYPPLPRFCLLGLDVPPAELARRIEDRVDKQLAAGWLDEVAALSARPFGLSRTAAQAAGYQELRAYLEGGDAGGCEGLREAKAATVRRLREVARRQRSWFRRDPRITWAPLAANPVAWAEDHLRQWWEWAPCSA
ncbi:MAG: tRNA (adenosine(37)-N6)-dimethylallyltransferase MiaA [Acidimicrobiales bacterium]|nr:tRNA (adenosine(37)-N6)-dimethylallyltransferase MiaA [Acidimicrobiales bacterium]